MIWLLISDTLDLI